MEWSVISAVNDEAVLKSSLLDSPGIQSATEIILQRGFASAGTAYNDAIGRAKTDLLVFLHQDMYLPAGWIESVQGAIETLSKQDPNWGVLGVWGAVDEKVRVGYLYWTGGYGWEQPFEGAKEVVSLDEVVLIFRKSSGLKFDGQLPGFHLYGADICLEARRQGRKGYAISAFCIHNTNIGGALPKQFWQCYFYMRRKWKKQLPIETPCTSIRASCWPVLRTKLIYLRDSLLGRQEKHHRAASPRELYKELLACGRAQPAPKPVATRDGAQVCSVS